MMTAGRLRAIRSHVTRHGDKIHPGVAHKFLGECITEIDRLRDALSRIAFLGVFYDKCDEDALEEILATVRKTFTKPDLGKPDFICRKCHNDD